MGEIFRLPYGFLKGSPGFSAWESLVLRVLWEHEIAGSNPAAEIMAKGMEHTSEIY